jgi:hypothetical protein
MLDKPSLKIIMMIYQILVYFMITLLLIIHTPYCFLYTNSVCSVPVGEVPSRVSPDLAAFLETASP